MSSGTLGVSPARQVTTSQQWNSVLWSATGQLQFLSVRWEQNPRTYLVQDRSHKAKATRLELQGCAGTSHPLYVWVSIALPPLCCLHGAAYKARLSWMKRSSWRQLETWLVRSNKSEFRLTHQTKEVEMAGDSAQHLLELDLHHKFPKAVTVQPGICHMKCQEKKAMSRRLLDSHQAVLT